MKLLAKPHNKPALPVISWKDIRDDAFAMLELLNNGKFPGMWHEGFALSHAQVSATPYDFFVTHKSFEGTLPRVICNARLVEQMGRHSFPEACLSFPHRQIIKTPRWWSIDVKYDIAPIDGFRSLLGVNRLKEEQAVYDGLLAVIFQHEIDHAKGIDIYHK